MSSSMHLPHRFVVPRRNSFGVTLGRRLTRWLLRCWENGCRRAERADRFVPYY